MRKSGSFSGGKSSLRCINWREIIYNGIVKSPKTVSSVIPGLTRNPVFSDASGSRIKPGMTRPSTFYESIHLFIIPPFNDVGLMI
jgi:hypothetical protein